jgi:phage host-nuclease inhibitor protein Gam
METVREQWTDERLDDLKGEVGMLRAEMRDEFRAVRTEMREEFSAVRHEIGSLRSEMHAGFASLQRTMIQFGGLLVAALIGLIATQL